MSASRLLPIISFLAGAMHCLPAYGLDYAVECSGAAVDADIDAGIAQTSTGPVRLVLSPGTCLIEATHQLNGAITLDVVGAGMASTILQGQGIAIPMFRVGQTAGGVELGLHSLTLQNAPLGAITVLNSALRVDSVQFSDNKAATVIVADFSAVEISNSRFVGNVGDGGTIRMGGGPWGHLTVTDTAFVGNVTDQDGGAINANVPVDLDRVLFVGNTANNGYGGAIYMIETGLSIRNSTFSGNSAMYGGAIADNANYESPGTTLRNVTLHGDVGSSSGSEIYLGGSSPPPISIFNSLVGGTCAGPAIAATAHGSVESPGDTCGISGAGNQVGVAEVDLHLGALADNGGATLTLYTNPGSVLIDMASTDCEGVDQRDLVRNVGGCDVGAVEAGATLADSIFADVFGN